jgi:GxGYxYP putative glycoside hydrolase C-terminal domain/GxGYxYP_N second domain/GxGYxYP_N 1st domain
MTSFALVLIHGLGVGDVATLLSLQGLANRDAPHLYLLPARDGAEAHWRDRYKAYGLESREMTLDEALAAHAKAAKGYIVYDPAQPASLNVAMVLAGVREAIVCEPAGEERLRGLGLECLEDLRGRWDDRLAAYRWAIDTAMKDCDCSVLANYDHGDAPGNRPTMDFLVARRGFCMGLCINAADYPEEAKLWDEVQTAAPGHAMMLGWHSMADVQKAFWLHPRRGEVPLGWEVAPVFAKVGPAVLEYYFETLTDNDYLVCGPSGIGYNYLSGFEDWQGYLKRGGGAAYAGLSGGACELLRCRYGRCHRCGAPAGGEGLHGGASG